MDKRDQLLSRGLVPGVTDVVIFDTGDRRRNRGGLDGCVGD